MRRLLGVALAVALGACGGSSKPEPSGGGEDAGVDTGGGVPDAGDLPGDPDAGAPDSGPGAPDASPLPPVTSEGWTFYGTGQGVPSRVNGASVDQGGNLWVAGGEQGLCVLRAGSGSFQCFGLAQGLRPYGEPRDEDQSPVTQPHLNAISVAGGASGVAYVGYEGWSTSAPYGDCEDNWYAEEGGLIPDPNIYKSGDADRVELSGSGIKVSHYDISSPKDFVPDEPERAREKICTVFRIAYDPLRRSVWFGGNHAYAWGHPDGTTVWEHSHPLLNGYKTDASTTLAALTDDYRGIALEPSGAVWMGGLFRSQRCDAGMQGAHFFDCVDQEGFPQYQYDWWKDDLPSDSRPSQRTDDHVSAMAFGLDGALWIGSWKNGLARRGPDGAVTFPESGLPTNLVFSLAVDPGDGSVWIGGTNGGLVRLKGEERNSYASVIGGRASSEVTDIQIDRSGPTRRVVVSFRGGSVGIYDGP